MQSSATLVAMSATRASRCAKSKSIRPESSPFENSKLSWWKSKCPNVSGSSPYPRRDSSLRLRYRCARTVDAASRWNSPNSRSVSLNGRGLPM